MFCHRWFFQLNWYFVAGVDGPPSVYKGNTIMPLPTPALQIPEKSLQLWVCLVFPFSSLTFPMFFHRWFFQLNCYFVVCINGHPLVYNGKKEPAAVNPCLPIPERSREWWFCLLSSCSSLPFSMFFHGWFFQLNCYFVADIDDHPSVYDGNKSPSLPSPTHESQREVGDGSLSGFSIFFPPILNVFSQVFLALVVLP